MRRLALIVLVVALAGCDALRDAFSARPQVAGTAAGQTLTVERLASLVGHASRIPVRPDVFTGVASVYLDYAVLATAMGSGRDLHDSTLVLAAEWPLVSQLLWERYHDSLIAKRGRLTPAQMDSAFYAGDVRLFQHILIRVPHSAVPMIEQQKAKEATRVLMLAAAQRGMNFRQLVQRYSEDPGSKARGGYLPATPRGQWVAAFDSAAWTLPPGAMTAVVRTPFGFHIIRRPPLAEVRDSFRVDLENARTTRLDSLYIDSLAREGQLKIVSAAPARVREAVPQIVAARSDDATLATYRGGRGAFRVRDLARWLLALDPNDVRGISTASDAQLTQLVRVLAQREMLKDSAPTPAARVQLAMAHVDRYADQAITKGTAPFVPVPPFLAAALREGQGWSLNAAGVARAVESAQGMRAADTTRGGGGRAASPTGLKRAPGPAPVPAESGRAPAQR
jgi:hypothetical protein